MNQILYSGKQNKNTIILPIIIGVVVVLVLLLILFGFGIANMFNDKILKGVIAANVNVSEMTKEEATEAINGIYNQAMVRNIELVYGEKKIVVSTDEIGFAYTKAEDMAEKAYQYGRSGNIIQNNFTVMKSYMSEEKVFLTEESINRKKLEKKVTELLSEDPEFSLDDTYTISGDKLIITKGTQGRKVEFDQLEERILAALKDNQMVVEMPIIVSEPQSLDIDKIYAKEAREPVNASYHSGEQFEIVKEENGVTFDVEEAKKKYATLHSGETAEIALVITEPEVKLDSLQDVLFRTVIATYSSKYITSDKNRVVNLQKAANECNNVILYPGESFSFHQVIGPRTEENGYKAVESYPGDQGVKTIGGGVAQVASTLYNAVLRADLTVTKRVAHSMAYPYVPQSTDAAILDDTVDLQLTNSRKYPVKLVVTCEDGEVTASIYGYKEENEARVEVETKVLETITYQTESKEDNTLTKGTKKTVQEGSNGYVSEAYKVYYDSDGKEINRKLISKDTYAPITEIVKVGTKVNKPVVIPTPTPVTPTPVPSGPALPPGWDNPESGY